MAPAQRPASMVIQVLLIALLAITNAQYEMDDYSTYDIIELRDTFGVVNASKVPKHELVWPSVQWRLGGDGRPVISRLIIRILSNDSDQFMSIPLHPIDDPIKGASSKAFCHFQTAQNDSENAVHAAISNCDGQLRGTILTATDIFTLHPLPKKRQQSFPYSSDDTSSFKTHVIIKRDASSSSDSSATNANAFCGLDAGRPVFSNMARDSPIVRGPPVTRVVASGGLTVEMAVFIDYEMWKKYWSIYGANADSALSDFVSTVFNNIQILYYHPTMTYKVTFNIVRYEVFKTQPDALAGYRHRDGDAQTYLDAFCMYQYGLPGRTWDQSLLITGYDIHRNYGTDKSISGIARLYGACDPFNSCVLVEGHDFTSVFIATHEIGHGFGMRHDEPYCPGTYIMSGSLGPGKVTWSSCSMNDMGKYIYKLDNNGKNCLRSTSGYKAVSIDLPLLPGQKYNADTQCSMMHGPGYRHVIPRSQYSQGACSMMWCGQNSVGRIITAHPALEGTTCGPQSICLRGRCSPWEASPAEPGPDSGPPSPAPQPPARRQLDGGWTEWTKAACSPCKCAPFGGSLGLVQSTRTCTSPAPSGGGRNCAGDSIRGIICNARCPATGDSVDGYIGRYCEWRRGQGKDPELTGKGSQVLGLDVRACKVFCDIRSAATGKKAVRFYGDLLPDGTPCGSGKYCAGGQCLTLACENSALVTDRSSCPSYYERCTNVGAVPSRAVIKASSVALDERQCCSQWSDWSSCSVTCGRGESTRIRLCITNGQCENVETVQTTVCHTSPCQTSDGWGPWSNWTQCSSSCDRGFQSRHRRCHSPYNCVGPSDERRKCNAGPCDNVNPISSDWSSWSTCSSTCGEGVQTRSRICNGSRCNTNSSEPDQETRPCITVCAEWSGWGEWSECYGSPSIQTRVRTCQGDGRCPGQLAHSTIDHQHRPCSGSQTDPDDAFSAKMARG